MLEVDVGFPALPDFGPSDVDDADEKFVDVTAELDAFQWVRHCATRMGQRKPLLKAVLDEIDRCEPMFFADRGHADVA